MELPWALSGGLWVNGHHASPHFPPRSRLVRCATWLVLERELARDGGDLRLPEQAIDALRTGIATLKASPFTCRKAAQSPFLRELVIPFGRTGYVALFEIEDASNFVVLAVRHQLEDDYH